MSERLVFRGPDILWFPISLLLAISRWHRIPVPMIASFGVREIGVMILADSVQIRIGARKTRWGSPRIPPLRDGWIVLTRNGAFVALEWMIKFFPWFLLHGMERFAGRVHTVKRSFLQFLDWLAPARGVTVCSVYHCRDQRYSKTLCMRHNENGSEGWKSILAKNVVCSWWVSDLGYFEAFEKASAGPE